MRSLAWFSAVMALTLALAGCASPPSPGVQEPSAPTADVSGRVAIPQSASRKVVLAMTGSADATQSTDWPEFQREWRETFAEHARDSGIAYSFAPGLPRADGHDGTLVVVDVSDYRIVTIGKRVWFGVMTGNAYITARVRYLSQRDGALYGEQQVSVSSSAWGGVFSKVTPQQVDAIAAQVFAVLQRPVPDAQVHPAPASPDALPVRLTGPVGTFAFEVEKQARQARCHDDGRASLVSKGPGLELYSVACRNGDVWQFRCEFGTCRVLR